MIQSVNIFLLRFFLAVSISFFAEQASAKTDAYDPLDISDQTELKTLDLTVNDKLRERKIPLRLFLPKEPTRASVVLFSHGLGGSCKGNSYLGKHWAARGYVAVFVQHPGSDTSIWKDKPLRERMKAMRQAVNLQNFFLRVKDIPAVLDQLEHWNAANDHPLHGRLNLDRVGMSGHSFGAVTTQAVSGQKTRRGNLSFTDSRIKAAIAFSPSSPRGVDAPQQAFGEVKIPWLLMTGTKDVAIIAKTDLKSRLAVFPSLPPGGKYELVLFGAEHSAFSDRALPGDTEPRNPNHHQAILALSTAFWDIWLSNDQAAKSWLDGKGPKSILEKNDRWQTK